MKNYAIGILTMCLLLTTVVYIAGAENEKPPLTESENRTSYPNLKVSGYIHAHWPARASCE